MAKKEKDVVAHKFGTDIMYICTKCDIEWWTIDYAEACCTPRMRKLRGQWG